MDDFKPIAAKPSGDSTMFEMANGSFHWEKIPFDDKLSTLELWEKLLKDC